MVCGPNRASGEPDPTALAAAFAVSGWHRLAFDAEARRLRQPGGLWLDLSGIARATPSMQSLACLAI